MMESLAEQALATGDLRLVEELYDVDIAEKRPSVDLYLGLADVYVKQGCLRKALGAYVNAVELGPVSPDRLNPLVMALADRVDGQERQALESKPGMDDLFFCDSCKTMWMDPVTLSCGHTFCKRCSHQTIACKTCGTVIIGQYSDSTELKVNILLAQMLGKWFPELAEVGRLKTEGDTLLEEGDFTNAVRVYSDALRLAPSSHVILSQRSHAYNSLKCHQEAFDDAEEATHLRADWAESYYHKGCALVGLEQDEEAAYAFLQSLACDRDLKRAQAQLTKTLHRLLTPIDPDSMPHSKLQGLLNPSSLTHQHTTTSPSIREAKQLRTLLQENLKKQSMTKSTPNLHTSKLIPGADSEASAPSSLMSLLSDKSTSCPSTTTSCPSSPHLSSRTSRSATVTGTSDCERASLKRGHGGLSPTSKDPPKYAKSESEGSEKRSRNHPDIPSELLDKDDFECALCFRLLYKPVTTPCGHVYCKQCLERCLDHRTTCPLCKSSLAQYLAERRQAVTVAIEQIIETYFPADHADREKIYQVEMENLAKLSDRESEVSIFVCTLAYPYVPCPLHIFEPRYRLMIRQCMESGAKQFGICICFDDPNNYADHGTMLEINEVHYFPDGRSIVNTVGGRRFKVKSRGMRDGYDTAKVEFLEDSPIEGPELQEVQSLHDETHREAVEWFDSLPTGPKRRITEHFGGFPDREESLVGLRDGPKWMWYIIAILPLDSRGQLAILAMTSVKERLTMIRRILNYVRSRST